MALQKIKNADGSHSLVDLAEFEEVFLGHPIKVVNVCPLNEQIRKLSGVYPIPRKILRHRKRKGFILVLWSPTLVPRKGEDFYYQIPPKVWKEYLAIYGVGSSKALGTMARTVLETFDKRLGPGWHHRDAIADKSGYGNHTKLGAALKLLVDEGFLERQKGKSLYQRTTKPIPEISPVRRPKFTGASN
jgi:hypothetical protein